MRLPYRSQDPSLQSYTHGRQARESKKPKEDSRIGRTITGPAAASYQQGTSADQQCVWAVQWLLLVFCLPNCPRISLAAHPNGNLQKSKFWKMQFSLAKLTQHKAITGTMIFWVSNVKIKTIFPVFASLTFFIFLFVLKVKIHTGAREVYTGFCPSLEV